MGLPAEIPCAARLLYDAHASNTNSPSSPPQPQPGFFFGRGGQPAPREILRNAPFGRIAFANTDLAGAMDHRYSILESQRAVGQLLDQVLTA
jgi:hypothetical protein